MTSTPSTTPLDEEALRRAYRAAEPFPFVVIDGFLEAGFARELASSLPSLESARRSGREFKAVNERGKVQVTRSEAFPPAVRALNELMAAPALLGALERITGVRGLLADEELVGGGIHLMDRGAHLDVHVDFDRIEERNLYRRLNLLLFLNEDWKDEWGGELELWDADVKRRHHAFAPRLNRLVLFETSDHSFHGVRRVRCPDGVLRRSFATYYYTREPAAQSAGHDTVFRARPGEWWKGAVLMPAEEALESTRLRLRRLGSRVKRTLRSR
jgi:hypothetical protein